MITSEQGAKPTLLLFAADSGPSEVERMVARAQWAAALDTIEKVLSLDLCDRVVVASDARELVAQLAGLPILVEPDEPPFHFGRQLRQLIRRHAIARPLYVGGGSAVIFRGEDFADLCGRLRAADRCVIPNNLWSSDFVGFVPGDAIEQIEPPAVDNNLAFLLNRNAGLPEVALPINAATQFDIDTPTDLLILSLRKDSGSRVRNLLASLRLDLAIVQAVARLLTDQTAEVLVAGRVGSAAWLHLESDTACRIRLFSEERGMRASGREQRGEARSLLAFYCQRYGPRGLFDALAELGHAAIVDSRVIFAHLGIRLAPADRFHSDLLQAERITHPFARAFTAAARDARIPILLGGHSVVSGGLWALVDAAWSRHDHLRLA